MEETTLDLREIIKILKKRSRFIINVFVFMVLAAIIISFILPPTYEAETTLRIKQPKGLASSLLSELPMGSPMASKQLMSTYAEILKSRTVVQEVIDNTQRDKEELPRYEDFIEKITTQPVKDTEVLKIKYQAKSAEEAQIVTNLLVDTFLKRMTSLVREEQATVREFIGQRLSEAEKELAKAESVLEQYKRDQKIVAPAEETKAMVERYTSISKMAAENTVALSVAQAKLKNIDSQLAIQRPGSIADSPLIQQYKAKLADLEVQLAGLVPIYTDKHPKVIAAKAAIEETKASLRTEIARILSADSASANPVYQGLLQAKIQAEVENATASAQKSALNQLLEQGEKEMATLPGKEQGLARVMRDAMVAQEIYIMLAKRHEEARISEVMQPTEVQVIDRAVVPDKPIKPKKALNIVIAAILGLFFGTGLAFGLEYMNKTIRNTEDVERYLELPVLGNIPLFDSEAKSQKISLKDRLTGLIRNKSN